MRLEVCSFELKLREVDVAGDAPGLEGELLTSVHELGAGAGGFDLSKLMLKDTVLKNMMLMMLMLINMVLMNMVLMNMVLMNMVPINMVMMMLVLVNMVPRVIIILIKTNLSLEPTGKELSTKED